MIKLLIKILVLFIFIGCEPAQKNELEKVIQKTKKIVEKKLINGVPIRKTTTIDVNIAKPVLKVRYRNTFRKEY